MALIKCPECGKEISDKARACPNCGYPIAKLNDKDSIPQNDNYLMSSQQHNDALTDSAYFKAKGEPLGKNYFDNPTRDYHGGYARQHHAEMRQIALQTVQEVAPKLVDEICTAIWNDALQRLVGAIDYDINTCVSIAFDDAEKIFKSKEAQKFISDKIVNELQREIDKIGTIKIR